MKFNFSDAPLAFAVRWGLLLVLAGLCAPAAQAGDELLSFSRVISAPVQTQPAPVSAAQPAVRPIVSDSQVMPNKGSKAAMATATQTPASSGLAQPIGSVSAVAYAGLPSRLAERVQKGNPVVGPTENELRKIFLGAVDAAVARSPKVLRSQGEQQAAMSDVDAAKGQRWPQVDVGTQTQAVQFGKGSDREQGSGGINVAVSTMLYDWGRVGNTIDSRKRLAEAAEENVAAERESVGFEVVLTLVELGKQRIIGELSQDFANRMEELVNMLAGIVAVDAGRASELTQAKARLLQAQALHDAASAKARDAEITLHKLIGERPVQIPRRREWNIRLPQLEPLLDVVKEHPTILQAKAQAESAELEAQAIRASGLPQLNWVVSKNTAEDEIGRERPWQTKLSVSWGVFRGGSTRAAERAALQRADASRQETEQQRQDLEFRIRTADNDARTQLERAELYRNLTVESNRIREAFYLQWHHLGKRTLLDVLTAENDHYGNQISEITDRFDGYQSILRQYASAGMLAQWLQGKR
ncbi:TolC family protein [Pseudomonas sp. NPDC087346]|uniref:TolC family protein n=1 Tax=Pseudomonas sp. NPDC087346 TaxID=3364438 RepID=UPI00382A2467